jgi:hypothetical protein
MVIGFIKRGSSIGFLGLSVFPYHLGRVLAARAAAVYQTVKHA